MQFFKPGWITHDDNKSIFSVDVHPKGNRFATGGQGGSGGRVVIWNLNPVINEKDEDDPKVAKMLCQMDNHIGCVNVVRWSNNGHYLASGSDDKTIMIWRLTSESSSSIFGSNQVNVETWKCVNTLNSHDADVLDLAWAPHDGWLASGSIDNTVIVWNAHKFPEKVAHLTNHTGLVKGVTWDPVGKYLASQSDDKSLRIWRTSDWNQQEVITDPFVDCSATTHVLRCSWSPDGQYLVSAHAMNGGGPTAQIIEREGWKHDKDFVGHRKAITCVRFNSNIFKKPSRESPSKSTQFCCCAIGSRDRSISIWLTSLKRPLVVVKELFDDSVLDISWSSQGDFLLACSGDGTVACIMFDDAEIGIPLTMDEKNALYERIYHRSLQSSWDTNGGGFQIIEDPEILLAIEEINQQKKSLNIEPPEIIEPPKPLNINIASPNSNQSLLVTANKQVETRLPSGKRRITPMLLKSCGGLNESLTPTDQSALKPSFSSSTPTKSRIVVEKRTSGTVTEPGYSAPVLQKVESTKTVVSTPPGAPINQLMCAEVPGDQPITKLINILDPLDLCAATVVPKEVGNIEIQVNNNCIQSISKIVVCKATKEKEPIWETFLGSTIRIIGSSRKNVVACCEDCTINVYDMKSGARLTPPLLIDDLVSCISLSQTGFLLVLTKTGLMFLWDLDSSKCVLNRISIRFLLSGRATVQGISLNSSNEPILTLSDGRAYSYSINFQTWLQLSNPLDPVSRASGSVMKNISGNLPLASLQREFVRYRTNTTLPPGVMLSFIETQIAASKVMQSETEFRSWLFVQVNHLLEKGPECRLRQILDDLMGPTHGRGKTLSLNDTIMGISKRKLLEDILGIIKTKLPWQRLYKEYKEQLDDLEVMQ